MMRGAAPVSAGGSGELAAADRRDRRGSLLAALLDSMAIPRRSSRSCAPSVAMPARRCRSYLDLVGYRLLDGFDISGRYALEMPDVLLRSIRITVGGRGTDAARTSTALIAEVRAARFPTSTARSSTSCSARRASCYRVRDERGVYSDIWASGLMRRAALAAGRRLAERGRAARRRVLRLRGRRRDVRAARGVAGGRPPTSWRAARSPSAGPHREGCAGAPRRRPARRRRTRRASRPGDG